MKGLRSRPGPEPSRRLAQALLGIRSPGVRRLPLSEATVLLVTDGLERAEIELLSAEASRLGRSCGRLFWLNPLLRYERFEPKARGMRALLPHVDRLLPMHDIASLEQVAQALSATRPDAVRRASRAAAPCVVERTHGG